MDEDPLADIHELPRAGARVKKLRLTLVLAGVGALAIISLLFGMMMAVASDLPGLENRAEYRDARNSVLYDVRNERLAVLTGTENRILLRADQIAPAMKHAVIAVEDRRFYENDGVDLRGIMRALVQDVLAGGAVQGGSTITQQFVKNAMKAENQRTIFQKLRESALALHLTRKWSKEKILTQYLNAVYFGNGAYGVESAARTYFSHEPDHLGCGTPKRPCAAELRPYEAALLAGIIASPSGFDPVSNPQEALQRRDLVLRSMLAQGYLSELEHRDAVEQALPGKVNPPQVRAKTPGSPYFTTWVRQQVVDRFGAQRAFSGGLRIKTTLDLDLQRAAEATVQKWLPNPDGPTAALVAIDNETGEVRAMVGGRDYREAPFNLATHGRRQPGSAFKPFILAEALKQGISPGSTWVSNRKTFSQPRSLGGGTFTVNNYENSYAGVTTLGRALTHSDNSVFAEVGIKVGTKRVARLARRMGVTTPISRNYAMTLGGLREGVTPLDMAHAYETFATGGRRVSGSLAGQEGGPVGIREVRLLRGGRVLASNEPRKVRVLPKGVAQTARSILSTVVTSGTAVRARIDRFAAGKTGTTENYGDAWFIGFTDRMTVAVWVGYPEGVRPMKSEFRGQPVSGGTFPAAIWNDFMTQANRVLDDRVDAERAKKGLPPRAPDGTVQPDPDAAPPSSPAPGATQPSPGPDEAPSGGAERQPQPAPAPAPEPEQPPAPAPAPTPAPAPPSSGTGAQGGGATPE